MSARQTPFEVKVESHGEAAVCRLIGSAGMEDCEILSERMLSAAADHSRLVIDLSQLEFICSVGLGGIVASYLHMTKKQGHFRLVEPMAQIAELLEITKLGSMLEIRDTVEQALSS